MSNHRTRGCSSVGRALRSHRRGRGFDYHQLHEQPFCIPPQEGFSLPCEVMAGFWGNRRSYGLSRLRPKVCPTTASTSGLPIPYLLPTLNGIPASAEAGTEEQSRRLMIDVLDALRITRHCGRAICMMPSCVGISISPVTAPIGRVVQKKVRKSLR